MFRLPAVSYNLLNLNLRMASLFGQLKLAIITEGNIAQEFSELLRTYTICA